MSKKKLVEDIEAATRVQDIQINSGDEGELAVPICLGISLGLRAQ